MYTTLIRSYLWFLYISINQTYAVEICTFDLWRHTLPPSMLSIFARMHTYVHVCIYIYIYIYIYTIVLNSRDWSEIAWLPEIFHFKNQPCDRLYLKKPAGMHWLGYNNAVSWLNEAKNQIFPPTANFENFKIYLYFVCQPVSQPPSLL